jgi:GTP-binding protein HflX
VYEVEQPKERAIIATFISKSDNRQDALDYLEELKLLVETAGAEVVDEMFQEMQKPSVATLFGSGKVQELKELLTENKCSMVVFDNELSSVQIRNLSNLLEVKVLDRSGIILDIFAANAKTLEAQIQVELAQNLYLLPRLSRMWTHLSKQYGGIGTKGPGETQIETDRRLIRQRIQLLRDKLKTIETQNAEQRKSRQSFPRFALVGYTNAGKSTLMNAITDANVYVEDKLFATLSTTVRQFVLPNNKKAILSDTVGFIRKLPHHLVASFRSTLAEASESDYILHVVDISAPFFREHIQIVNDTLESLNINISNLIYVFNKIDKLEYLEVIKHIETEFPKSVFVSAIRNININALLDKMQEEYEKHNIIYNLHIPYTKMNLINQLYNLTDIIDRLDQETGIDFKVKVLLEKKELFEQNFKNMIK